MAISWEIAAHSAYNMFSFYWYLIVNLKFEVGLVFIATFPGRYFHLPLKHLLTCIHVHVFKMNIE